MAAAAIALAAGAGTASAEIVELQVAPGVRASAEYLPGKPALPAVVLVHGFLQTRSSPVIAQLSEQLASQGYTVLAPTLSLGIDLRRQSLDCEAVHTHTMEQDVAEIRQWTAWLGARGAKRIALVGHSTGAVQVLAYVADRPAPQVRDALLLSPVYFGARHAWLQTDLPRLRAQAEAPDPGIEVYRFVYCDRYPAPPSAVLSYANWNRARSLAALAGTRVPVQAIFGTVDPIVPEAWTEEMQAAGVGIHRIEGGDHFFSDMAEIDLHETVEHILERVAPQGP